MDPSTAVRTDTLPAIATLVVPGAIASSGYVWMGVRGAPSELVAFLGSHEAIATVAAVLVWVATGFAVDSTASYVEVYALDRRRTNHEEMLEYWWRYLTLPWEHEPIGQHYIRRLLVSFKFELNMFVAVVVAAPSVPMLAHYGLVSQSRGWAVLAGLLISAIVFFVFARSSSDVLANVRRRLVDAATGVMPTAAPSAPIQSNSTASPAPQAKQPKTEV